MRYMWRKVLFLSLIFKCTHTHTHMHSRARTCSCTHQWCLSCPAPRGPPGFKARDDQPGGYRLSSPVSGPSAASHICLMHTSSHEVMRWECDREQTTAPGLGRRSLAPASTSSTRRAAEEREVERKRKEGWKEGRREKVEQEPEGRRFQLLPPGSDGKLDSFC